MLQLPRFVPPVEARAQTVKTVDLHLTGNHVQCKCHKTVTKRRVRETERENKQGRNKLSFCPVRLMLAV